LDDRYDGKPLLRLMECYVLKAIDALDTQEESGLERMEPGLSKVLGRKGSWDKMLAEEMNLPGGLSGEIHKIWRESCQIAARESEALEPNDFAQMFVDANFPS